MTEALSSYPRMTVKALRKSVINGLIIFGLFDWERRIVRKAKEKALRLGKKIGFFLLPNEENREVSEDVTNNVLEAKQVGFFGLGSKQYNIKIKPILAEVYCLNNKEQFTVDRQQAASLIKFTFSFSSHNTIIKHNSNKVKLLLEEDDLVRLKSWSEYSAKDRDRV